MSVAATQRYSALFLIEARATAREIVPFRPLRWALAAIVLLLVLASVAGAFALPVRADRVDRAGQVLFGALSALFVVSAGLGLRACASVLREPWRAELVLLSPIPPAAATLLRLAPLAALALVPIVALYGPFVVVLLREAPASAAVALLTGALAAAWGVVGAALVLVGIAERVGRDRAGLIAQGSGRVSVALAALVLPALLRLGAPLPFVALAVAAAAAALPFATIVASRSLLATVSRAEPARIRPAPRWGRPTWWRLVARSSAPWAVAGAVPAIVAVLAAPAATRWSGTALLLVLLATVPLAPLFGPERAMPERWRLAPRARAMGLGILRDVGAPTLVVVAVVTIGLGAPSWGWIVAVVALAACAQVTNLAPSVGARRLAASAVFLGAAAAGLLHG